MNCFTQTVWGADSSSVLLFFTVHGKGKRRELEFWVKKEGLREQDDWITRWKMGEFDALCKIRLQIADAYEGDGCWRGAAQQEDNKERQM